MPIRQPFQRRNSQGRISQSKVSRRTALKCATGAVGAFGLPYIIPSGVLASEGRPGANDRIIIGFIGTGNRAKQLMDQVPAAGRIVSVADCYLKRAEDAM